MQHTQPHRARVRAARYAPAPTVDGRMRLVLWIALAAVIGLGEADAQGPPVVCAPGGAGLGPPKIDCRLVSGGDRRACNALDLALRRIGRNLAVAREALQKTDEAKDDARRGLSSALDVCAGNESCERQFALQMTFSDYQEQEQRLLGILLGGADDCDTTNLREQEEISGCLFRQSLAESPEERARICTCHDGQDND